MNDKLMIGFRLANARCPRLCIRDRYHVSIKKCAYIKEKIALVSVSIKIDIFFSSFDILSIDHKVAFVADYNCHTDRQLISICGMNINV